MLEILSITGPIYIAIAIGFFAVKSGVFSASDMRVLGKFVMSFALPAMLFSALIVRPIGEMLSRGYLITYLGGTLLVFLPVVLWLRYRNKQPWSFAAVCGVGAAFSNSGYVGYPIAYMALGSTLAGVALAQCVLIENLIMLPLFMVLAARKEGEKKGGYQVIRESLSQLRRSPIVLAIVAGAVISLFGLHLSAALNKTISLFSSASAGLSLFVIGGTLASVRLQGVGRQVAAITFCKLLIHPLAVFAIVWSLPSALLSNSMRAAAVLFAAMPMMGIYPILAQKYHYEGMAAACVLLATIVSFFTVSALLWLLHSVGWLSVTALF